MPLGLLSLLVATSGPALAQSTPSDAGDLTITEFMAEPQVVPNYYGEWFEIYNASGRNLNITGLRIQGASDDAGFVISESTTLAAGAYLVLGVSDDTDQNGNVDVDIVYERSTFPLEEAADSIKLVYDSVTLDEVIWDSADWAVQKTAAHQANNNAFDLEWANDLPHNWCSSDTFISSGLYGTPGAANAWCDGSNNDSDADGFTEATGDCDDTDDFVNPDAIDGTEDPYGSEGDDADCDGVRDDGDVDNDGDGYSEVDGDCNDGNSAFNPGAVEIYDDEDNDCNGCADDFDDDNDGYTECETDELIYCGSDDHDCDTDPSNDQCVLAYDCNDADNFVYPCAAEVAYSGVDEDCNGEDLCDFDGDGYDAEECPDPGPRDGDCDDGDETVNPGASEGDPEDGGEADGLDNDCNGTVDDPYQDLDGDNYTKADGDCWDVADDLRSAQVHPGAEEICTDFFDNDCNGLYNDGCEDPGGFAVVQGGGLCATARGGGLAGGAAVMMLLSLLAVGARRRRTPGAEDARRGHEV